MKQIETLQLIRARCVELLEQAKLRTPGVWETDLVAGRPAVFTTDGVFIAIDVQHQNSTYIANASVAFEAALESTVAAVDVALASIDDIQGEMPYNIKMCEQLITAWKHLLP